MVLYNSIKQSIYISRQTPYLNWFGYEEIWCLSTCIHGDFTKLDSAVCLRILHMVL